MGLKESFPTLAKELDKVQKRADEIDALIADRQDEIGKLRDERKKIAKVLSAFGDGESPNTHKGYHKKEERRLIVDQARSGGTAKYDEFCKQFHITNETLMKWFKEFPPGDMAANGNRPREPIVKANQEALWCEGGHWMVIAKGTTETRKADILRAHVRDDTSCPAHEKRGVRT